MFRRINLLKYNPNIMAMGNIIRLGKNYVGLALLEIHAAFKIIKVYYSFDVPRFQMLNVHVQIL